MKNNFKVGDRVRAINDSYGWGDVKKGDEGEITIVVECGVCFSVDFPNQKEWTAAPCDLEFVRPKVEFPEDLFVL